MTIEYPEFIRVVLPSASTRSNSGTQHGLGKAGRDYRKERNKYYDFCHIASYSQKRKIVHLLPLPAAMWEAHIEVYNGFDADNLMASLKWPIDFLVRQRWLKSDDWKVLWPRSLPTQEIKQTGERLTYFTLYPTDETMSTGGTLCRQTKDYNIKRAGFPLEVSNE